jgi:predicted mannosyl-3-phosphoglycerate phosphatase (HAD superfamily)
MIQEGAIFEKKEVENYVDVGTAEDWHEYNDRPTIFCDIDGTLVKAQSRFGENSYESEPIPLEENIKKIKEYEAKDCELIFVTSRPTKDDIHTLDMLQKLGFTKFRLISGLNNAARMLINDYTSHAPYPRAIAVNIHRDRDNLKEFI